MRSFQTVHSLPYRWPLLFSLATVLAIFPHAGFGGYRHVAAMTTQVALFRGFSFIPDTNTGMDILNTELSMVGIPNYEGMVFDWNQKQEAYDWIEQEGDRSTLVLIGHSFGANSALQLANNFLKPVGIDVDLTIQVDSVENFDGGWNDQLPTNVDVGINYFQISGGGFGDFQGEMNVQGATNINAEVLFNDNSITHTSLDNDPRLHDEIEQNILDNLNQENADFDGNGYVDGADFLLWQRDPTVGLLADWETNYGTVVLLSAASAAVPEPSSMALLSLGAILFLRRKRGLTTDSASL